MLQLTEYGEGISVNGLTEVEKLNYVYATAARLEVAYPVLRAA
jgi:hypothetical protein